MLQIDAQMINFQEMQCAWVLGDRQAQQCGKAGNERSQLGNRSLGREVWVVMEE